MSCINDSELSRLGMLLLHYYFFAENMLFCACLLIAYNASGEPMSSLSSAVSSSTMIPRYYQLCHAKEPSNILSLATASIFAKNVLHLKIYFDKT